MQMQRRNSRDNFWNHQLDRGLLMESPPSTKLISNGSSSYSMQSSCDTSPGGGGGSSVGDGGLGYIEHTVTKFDTLAGVAIKYGVEVADIKKMNGLTTDLQMFARKTLQIPLPGRHPPSPIMSNGHDSQGPKKSEVTPVNRRHSDFFDSVKSVKLSSSSPRNVSPSMDALRNYYGLKPKDQNGISERFGMDAYQKGGAFSSSECGPKPSSQSSYPPHGLHRKCKSLAHGLSDTSIDGDLLTPNGKQQPESDTWYDKLIRRRKSEVDLKNHTPEMMLKPDTTNNSSAFSAAAGKGLALRPKAANRTSDAELAQHLPPLKTGESSVTEASGGVKKSSSSPSFYDGYNSNNNGNCMTTSSIWPTSMLNLTADLQASTAAIARPIFDGLPKPMSGRKNKAAID